MSKARSAGGLPKVLRRKQVEARLNISRWTLARLVERDPTFPRFIELTPGVEVMRESDLVQWFRRKEIEARSAPSATSCYNTHGD
jgi:predicted DNA-binding transcriptional regulator AlpA